MRALNCSAFHSCIFCNSGWPEFAPFSTLKLGNNSSSPGPQPHAQRHLEAHVIFFHLLFPNVRHNVTQTFPPNHCTAETKLDFIAWRDQGPFMRGVGGTSGVQDTLEEPPAQPQVTRTVPDPAAVTGCADLPCTKQHLSYCITQVAGPAHERAKSPARRPGLCELQVWYIQGQKWVFIFFFPPPWTSDTTLS